VLKLGARLTSEDYRSLLPSEDVNIQSFMKVKVEADFDKKATADLPVTDETYSLIHGQVRRLPAWQKIASHPPAGVSFTGSTSVSYIFGTSP
jgi:hypothetical protein